MTKKYLIQVLRKNIPLVLILSALGILFFRLVDDDASNTHQYSKIFWVEAIGIVACLIFPIYNFLYLMNKRKIDMMYSLPVNKDAIFKVNYLIGGICMIIIFTLSYLFGFLYFYINDANNFALAYLEFYGVSLIYLISLYSIICFFFTRANSVVDGIIMIGLTYAASLGIFTLLYQFLVGYPHWELGIGTHDYFSIYNNFTSQIKIKMTGGDVFLLMNTSENNSMMIYIFSLFGITSMVGMLTSRKHLGAEKAETVTSSVFGYDVMLPIVVTTLVVVFGLISELLMGIIMLLGYVLYAVYRKNIKLKYQDYIALALSIGVGLTIFILTKGWY